MNLPTIPRITVDIDINNYDNDLLKLITSYVQARILFGKNNVTLYVSPSGRGFRIYINAEVNVFENILYRALFNDDPYRLVYSLKRYFLTSDPDEIDVEFIYKDYKKGANMGKNTIKEINFETNEKLKDILNKLEECYGKKEFEQILLKHLEDFKSYLLPNMKPILVLYIVLQDNKDIIDKIINYVTDNKGYYRLYPDVYYEDRVVLRITTTEDNIKEILDKFKNYIIKYRVVSSVSKY